MYPSRQKSEGARGLRYRTSATIHSYRLLAAGACRRRERPSCGQGCDRPESPQSSPSNRTRATGDQCTTDRFPTAEGIGVSSFGGNYGSSGTAGPAIHGVCTAASDRVESASEFRLSSGFGNGGGAEFRTISRTWTGAILDRSLPDRGAGDNHALACKRAVSIRPSRAVAAPGGQHRADTRRGKHLVSVSAPSHKCARGKLDGAQDQGWLNHFQRSSRVCRRDDRDRCVVDSDGKAGTRFCAERARRSGSRR